MVELSIFNLCHILTSVLQPTHLWTGGSYCGVIVQVFSLVCCCIIGVMRIIGRAALVNQCQPGWADCIWWSWSDQMASWHKQFRWWVCVQICIFMWESVYVCVCWDNICGKMYQIIYKCFFVVHNRVYMNEELKQIHLSKSTDTKQNKCKTFWNRWCFWELFTTLSLIEEFFFKYFYCSTVVGNFK